jgi:hypothetical protein
VGNAAPAKVGSEVLEVCVEVWEIIRAGGFEMSLRLNWISFEVRKNEPEALCVQIMGQEYCVWGWLPFKLTVDGRAVIGDDHWAD